MIKKYSFPALNAKIARVCLIAVLSITSFSIASLGRVQVQNPGVLSNRAHPTASVVIMTRVSGAAESLQDMLDHPIVALGKVTSIYRTAHTPYHNPGPEQHTVFSFHVQRYIKDDTRTNRKMLLVRQNMGNLPWVLNGQIGIGLRIVGEPMLEVGRRYVLFLRKVSGSAKQGYVEATINGYSGISGEAGECLIPAGEFGQFPINNGVVSFAHTLEGPRVPEYMFPKGPQVIGQLEERVTQILIDEYRKKEIKKASRRSSLATGKVKPPLTSH